MAVEKDGAIYEAARKDLDDSGFPACLVRASLAEYLKETGRKFDILYFDACGWQAIETIKPGDSVWSRNQDTGETACRPVLSTVVTHPTTLHHIIYRVWHTRRAHVAGAVAAMATGETREEGPDSPPGSTNELICTGEHPFFVQERQDFVEARNLQVGYSLVLSDGLTATVVANTTETAAEGQTFTTYNFEVAEFHTYFAGKRGVWVHNAGRECERFFTLSQRMADRDGINLVEAAGKAEEYLPKISREVKHSGYSDSIKSVLNGEKIPDTVTTGPDFEVWLRQRLGGQGGYKITDPKTGNDITEVDCLVGRRWMEIKFRSKGAPHPDANTIAAYKKQLTTQWLEGAKRDQTLEFVTNFDLPPDLQEWLTLNDIPWTRLE